jgi:hypothetical protein
MSDDTLPTITGTLPQGSIGDPANLLDSISGEATGTVSGPGIEAQLATLGAEVGAPPPLVVMPAAGDAEFFMVKIAGGPTEAEVYLSNGDLEMRIPRNKAFRIPARALEVLKQTQGIQFEFTAA